MFNRYVSLQIMTDNTRVKIDKRTDDLKRGYMRYYNSPSKSSIKRLLRAFDNIDDRMVVCHPDGYSIATDTRWTIIPGTSVICNDL